MTRAGDPASCAVLAADLRWGAHRLREGVAGTVTNEGDAGTTADVTELAGALEGLGDALADFAAALREDRPTRTGRAHPHTTLRAVCRRVCDEFGDAQSPR